MIKYNIATLGEYVAQDIKNINQHYSYAQVHLFTIMPNHIHAIIEILPESKNNNSSSHTETLARTFSDKRIIPTPTCGTLPIVVRGFKSAITKYANQNNISFAWQARYHDHIIRNNDELNNIAKYIEDNPAKWQFDEMNSL